MWMIIQLLNLFHRGFSCRLHHRGAHHYILSTCFLIQRAIEQRLNSVFNHMNLSGGTTIPLEYVIVNVVLVIAPSICYHRQMYTLLSEA